MVRLILSLTKVTTNANFSYMNVRPYQIINSQGDKKFGKVHKLAVVVRERKTRCGHYLDRQFGFWEETDEPVDCPRCLRFSKANT